MGIIKDITDTVISFPKLIEEINSDDTASYLEMDRSIQLDRYSCGVQAAYSILNFYGKALSINNVEKLLGTDTNGTSETALIKLFRRKGLKVSYRKTATFFTIKESIDEYVAPFLTTIDNGNHWIVVYGYSRTSIFVLDSSLKRPFVKWSKTKFKSRWDKWGAIIYK